jgi:uncharacterized protein YjbI with pentapeptide repeats
LLWTFHSSLFIKALFCYGEVVFNQPVDSLRELLVSYHAGVREFKGASLEGANLQGACLQSANLSKASLTRANLKNANLQQANLTEANLSYANLQGTHLEGANLRGADLEGTSLKQANCGGTILPDGRICWSGLTRC